MEKKQIIINDLLINYYSNLVENSKYNIIFLHGWRSEAKVWNNLMTNLEYSTFALDLPGFGESQSPNKAYTLQDFSETLSQFIQKLTLTNIVLVGHSNGGAVSIKFNLLNPEAIQKLILVDSAGLRNSSMEKSLKGTVAKIVKPIFKPSFMQPLRKRIYSAMGSEDYLADPKLQETYLNMISEDLSSQISNVNCPTLIIWGTKDQATPLSDGEFMQQNIKNSELKIIEGVGHFSFLENKDLALDYIKTFLAL